MSRDSTPAAISLQILPTDEPAPSPRGALPPPIIRVPPRVLAGVRYGAFTARYFLQPRIRRRGAGAEPGGWKVRCARCGGSHVLPEAAVRGGKCPNN